MNRFHKHLVLSLGRKGLGEASLGIRLATDLQDAGDEVFFLAHDSNAKLFSSDFAHQLFPSHASPFFPLYLSDCLESFAADSLILSDYFTTTLFFESFGLHPEVLVSRGRPLFAIDTWDYEKVSDKIDLFVSGCRTVSLWPDHVIPLRPVPFLQPEPGRGAYRTLPVRSVVSEQKRNGLRRTYGVPAGAKAVLFCTATWQHAEYESEAGRRMAQSLPRLLADFLAAAGDQVHLVHVGPQAYPLSERMAGRYHWLPALSPGDFDALLASMDLLLSANISATTITKAMVLHVPVLVVENSVAAGSLEQAMAALPHPPSALLESWLRQSLPLFPFSLWPLGYHRFLTPVLRNNPYVDALERVEMLDEATMRRTLATLLFDSVAREEHCHRQQIYLDKVRSLPSGAQCVRAGLAN